MPQLQIQETVKIQPKSQEDFINQLLLQWKFYLPKQALAERILLINDKIGDQYFKERYRNICNKKEDTSDLRATESEINAQIRENLDNPSWHQRVLKQIKSILFHDDEVSSGAGDNETIQFFRKYISERIYNHLAMLARSPHARKGGAFSLREDFALEIAGKIGLGLYFSDRISSELRAEIEDILFYLAEDFENWFIEDKRGHFSATFGEVYSFERRNENSSGKTLILHADIGRGSSFAA